MMNETDETEPKTCVECNWMFPASEELMVDYAICLRDPEFEPFIEELVDHQDYSRYRDLIEQKKFPVDRTVCADFDPAEILEIPDVDDETNPRIEYTTASGEEYRTADVRHLLADLRAGSLATREQAFRILTWHASWDNEKALEAVLDYFEELPPPATVSDAHHKIRVFEDLRHVDQVRSRLRQALIEELCRVDSNNTTRQDQKLGINGDQTVGYR